MQPPLPPQGFIHPGRVARLYTCKRCGKTIQEFSIGLDLETHKVLMSGHCEQGHEFKEEVPAGAPLQPPVFSELDFIPIPGRR
jgi:hypothetical protein